MPVMPMFPLGSVLLPGGLLPLHVFEPRYRQMIIDCLQEDGEPEFGQVLITHGREAGGGDERAMVGTVAQVLQIDALDEGRYALVAVGTRRIRVNAWLPDDPYPLADVDEWPDEDPDPDGLPEAVHAAHERVRATLTLAARLDAQSVDPSTDHPDATDAMDLMAETDISSDPLVATYHLAAIAPLGPADRYRLLAAPGPRERLVALDEILDDVDAMLEFRLT
jgi:Lon protease-like protein